MELDLRVLDHLGINLYSNAAAVLSEAVANSYDADADHVKIDVAKDAITIDDDGVGMNLDDINKRFLNVGYDKRGDEGDISPKGRRFMGRKGIGKLALFSIADSIEIHTVKGKERHAFLLQTIALRRAIKSKQEYRPKYLKPSTRKKGVRIILSDLKKKRTARTADALRKRIARRFSIIGRTDISGGKFDVIIDGKPVGRQDRDDLKAVEFLWEFGNVPTINKKDCPSLKKRFLVSGAVQDQNANWVVKGWFGASAKPNELKNEQSGTMNGLVVLARGRLIQENILDKLSFNRLFNNYLTGQIEADFLDVKDEDDIATSDRQRLIEDDERFMALTHFLRNILLTASDEWTVHRNEARGKEAITSHPVLGEWIEGLPSGQRKAAERMFGIIQGVELEKETERLDLYKAGMVAFERLRLRDESHKLGEEGALTAETLLPLLSDLSSLEGSMYRDIVRSRLDVIRKFEDLVDAKAKEKVLQEHLFKNLWLLDPGWERATGSQRIEQRLKTQFKDFKPNLTDKESKGRADIRYRTNAGVHIIVELKKAERKLHVEDLQEQGKKYRTALHKCLRAATNDENPHIQIVFVLGQPVYEEEESGLKPGYVKDTLALLGARVVYYEQLIQGARESYAEYLDQSAKTDKLDALLKRLAKERSRK